MKVLSIPLPFMIFIKRLLRQSFRHFFADPQSSGSGMQPALPLIKTADPAVTGIIFPVAAEDFMHLIHKAQSQVQVFIPTALLIECQIIADCKGIGPQITVHWPRSRG